MPNRLAQETSPYLLQHAGNPVDWYPWGSEALERARRENKPILLSVGYAACHWCHVMEHESFEDAETARVMNENFVSVKVDREERPDIDSIYMQAVQAMTGHGGWPMTVFLTPDGAPFYGGTYFPPEDRPGMPSFRTVLHSVSDAFRDRPDAIARTADQLRDMYRDVAAAVPAETTELTAATLDQAFRSLAQQNDAPYGGFGAAPKFPQTMALDFLLRHWRRTDTEYALEIVRESYRAMAHGGIYDQIGGGFARYSVDAKWLVPHFEKMLYDNALLARLGVHLWQATKDEEMRRVTEETLTWTLREMTSPEGGFYSSLDADSEGHEGKFYVWSEDELDRLLGEDAPVVKHFFGVSAAGNFEGENILHAPASFDLAARRLGSSADQVRVTVARGRDTLYAARAKRVWPGRDEKILASWNGLMLRAFSVAGFAFGDERWRTAALRNATFLARELVRDGRVWRVHKAGRTHTPGFLEDQAAVGVAFAELYGFTGDTGWLVLARQIRDRMVESFYDRAAGLFYDTAHDAERLITRPRDISDNAVPSGSSLAAELLLLLAELDDDAEGAALARQIVGSAGSGIARYPLAFGHLLGVADALVRGGIQVAITAHSSDPTVAALLGVVAERYLPALALAQGDPDASDAPRLLRGRGMPGGAATAHVCRAFTCTLPTSDQTALARELDRAAKVAPP